MTAKPTEATRAPLNESLRGPSLDGVSYIRSGSHVPAGGNVKLMAPEQLEMLAKQEADEAKAE